MSTNDQNPFLDKPRRQGGNALTHVLCTIGVIAIAAMVVIGIAIVGFDWHPFKSDKSGDTGVIEVAKQDPKCNGFTVKLDPNWSHNVFSKGVSPKTEEMRTQISQGSKQDPRTMQLYWNVSPMGNPATGGTPITDVTQIAPLKDGECFTAFGAEKYNVWNPMWMNPALTKLTPDALPATGVNSGATPGGQAFEQAGAIPNGTGARVEYYDASGKLIGKHWVRLECGNVVKAGTATVVSPPPPGTTIVTPPPTVTPPPGCPGGCVVTPPPTCENGGIPPELCVPVTPPPTCENGGIPPEQCVPVTCPPGYVGTPPNCLIKDYGNGAEPSLPPQIPYTPAPAQPQYAEPSAPVLPPPPPVYTPPTQTPVVPAPTLTPNPTPRTTVPAPQTEAPVPSAPQTTCIPAPGKSSC